MKWLADENFDNDILRGVFGRSPGFDVVRVQDIPAIYGKGDPAMRLQLERAALCTPIVLVPDSLPIDWASKRFCCLMSALSIATGPRVSSICRCDKYATWVQASRSGPFGR